MADNRQYTALEWVIKEINETLQESQRVLEFYANDVNDVTQLRFCQTLIHQVYGSLHMVGFHGAAMLAEEMEALAQALLNNTINDKNDALEVLMRAILQLPDYLERVQLTKRDYPAVVLSLLNDIRAVRGASLLSESSLFTPNLSHAHKVTGRAHALTQNNPQLKTIIGKLRKMYRYAASSIINGIKIDENLNYLVKATTRLQQLLQGTKHYAVWEVAQAVIDGLHKKIIEPSAAIKNLLRDLDRELKALEMHGTAALGQFPPDILLKNLLYYIGSTETQSSSIESIKKLYELDQLMPLAKASGEDDITPIDGKTLRAVGSAIREEFVEIKERLNNCLNDNSSNDDLGFIQTALQRVNDTLAVLGVGELRQAVNDAVISLASLRHQSAEVSSDQLIDVANHIADIEARLDGALLSAGGAAPENVSYLNEAQVAAVEECRNGLEQAKNSIVDYIATQWDIERLKPVPQFLRDVRGNLLVLSLNRVADILSGCIVYIESHLINQEIKPKWQQLDGLADVIASVDYYLEFISAARENDVTIIEKAEKSLEQLGVAKAKVASIVPAPVDSMKAKSVELELEAAPDASVIIDISDVSASKEPVLEEEDEDELIDAEVAEIFIEEVGEIRERLDEFFPRWADNYDDEESLTETRRAFHTLKGSGRMVKATDVGELAWSIENMLNRVIDDTISPATYHTALIEKVLKILPDMVDAYKEHRPNPKAEYCEKYMAWGHEFSRGEVRPEVLQALSEDNVAYIESQLETSIEEVLEIEELLALIDEEPLAKTDAQSSAEIIEKPSVLVDDDSSAKIENIQTEEIDTQLWEIFQSEAETHLSVVNEFIDRMDSAKPFYEPPSDAMQRALHTLKGSAHMAELTPIAELVTPLEKFTKELRSYQVNIDDDILQLMKDGVAYTQHALSQIERHTYPVISKFDQFMARVDELRERSVGPLIRQKEAEKAQQEVDPAILEMLMAEEMNLLLDADLMLEEWQQRPAEMSEWKALHDELATLSHGVERANLPVMTNMSKALETVYAQLMNGQVAANEENYAVMLDAHNCLMDIVDAIAAGQDLPSENTELLERLSFLKTNSVDAIKTSEATDTSKEEEPFNHNNETTIAEELSVEMEEPSAEIEEQPSIEFQQEQLVEIEELSTEALEDEAEEVVIEGVSSNVIDYLDDDDEIDEETVEIFLEEAHELLEELDEIIHEWESGADDADSNEGMQRALHTLKGGARLAGLTTAGDVAHDFETYLIDNSRGEQAHDIFEQIHHYQDRLIAQVNAITNKEAEAQEIASEPVDVETDTSTRDDSVDASEEDLQIEEAGFSIADEFNTDSPVVSIDSAEKNEPSAVPANDSSVPVGDNVVPFAGKSSPLTVLKEVPQASGGNPQASSAAARRSQPQEVVKVSAELMEELVNLAGETSISRGRMEEQVSELGYSLDEMGATVQRLQEQLRRLDIETEAQVIFRQEQMAEAEEFDPLEMDRYSQLQQLSRSLIESASDLMDLKSTLTDKTRDAETVLLQQSRINTDLQEGLMRSRMVPFSRIVPRLRRIVRQIATELNKDVNLELGNIEGELDRSMMERMVAPLEHMLRNAIDHGLEDADTRVVSGKPAVGRIVITLDRDGGDVLIHVADDGRGIDVDRVRAKAIERNLMNPDAELGGQEILQFILHAGFSTAESVTQISGRGVGMDVVNSEIRQMGGSIGIDSRAGEGTAFTIRVPFTVSVNRALMVSMGDDRYAIPLNTIEGIVRISPFELENYYANPDEPFEYAGQNYQLKYLGTLLDHTVRPRLHGHALPLPVLLVRSADHSVALQVDHLQGSREIVVKSLGPQFRSVQGLSGATIMGDGHVVVILDLNALIRSSIARNLTYIVEDEEQIIEPVDSNPLVMVVDDSVTVRKVTSRLLEREGYDVITAKDGVDAMTTLQDHDPDIMLLDIEMPRMDGFEVAKNVRSNRELQHLPIIMITSRTGEKHRQRGLESGANMYMGKPYQEEQLLESIRELISANEHSNV